MTTQERIKHRARLILAEAKSKGMFIDPATNTPNCAQLQCDQCPFFEHYEHEQCHIDTYPATAKAAGATLSTIEFDYPELFL